MQMRSKRFLTVGALMCSLFFSGWSAAQAQADITIMMSESQFRII